MYRYNWKFPNTFNNCLAVRTVPHKTRQIYKYCIGRLVQIYKEQHINCIGRLVQIEMATLCVYKVKAVKLYKT